MNADRLLVQLTDCHLFATPDARLGGVDTRHSFEAVLAAALAGPPDAILLTGDLAEHAEPEAYTWLAARCAALDVPVQALAGNHDAPAPLAAALPTGGFDLGAWRVVTVDTHWPAHAGGRLTAAQAALLARELERHAARPVLVAMHHPPVAIGSPWMDAMALANPEDFWPLVEGSAAVRAVVFGHVHQSFDVRRGGVRVLGTPSTCVQFMPGATRYERDPRPPGYRRLWLRADGALETDVVRVPI